MTRAIIPLLSKSRFGAGLQCPRRLYLECYAPEFAEPPDVSQKSVMEAGIAVGRLARQRFPGGRLVKEAYYEHDAAVTATLGAIKDRSIPAIYEAAFTFDDVRVRADVLSRNDDGTLDLVEVKSSASVKEEHISDVGIQLHVLEGSGITVRRACLLHIDNTYVYEGGPYDLGKLFQLENVTDEVRDFVQLEVPLSLAEMKKILRRENPPDLEFGRQCSNPYHCEFYGHCRKGSPEHHIEQLPRVTSELIQTLLAVGIRDIRDIPEGFPGLSRTQLRVRDCLIRGRAYVGADLAAALGGAEHPLHFLDFETFGPALPVYRGTRAYQAIPSQWSLHVRDSAGNLTHRSFLHDGKGDPREAFVLSLLDAIELQGTIVVYTSFEQSRLRELAVTFPRYSDHLMGLCGRMLDLHAVIRDHYYHPGFHGSYSMKAILPAVVPDLGYDDLEIHEGAHASAAFARMIAPETEETERQHLRQALLDYCRRDTEAMVRVIDALRGESSI
jgi:hypothetical protein